MSAIAALAGSAHSLPQDEVLARLGTDPARGLEPADAQARLLALGPNVIPSVRGMSLWAILIHQLASPVVYLLAGAAALAAAFGEWAEAAAILVVVVLNTLIGFFTETRARQSMDALRSLGGQAALVLRGGRVAPVPAAELVPGDIVEIEAGDAVAADLRLVAASNLAAGEAALTGESVPVEKAPAQVAAQTRLADRTPMLFKGTVVVRGSGRGVVVASGRLTELGRIAAITQGASPERSPIEKNLDRLAGQLVWLTLALVSLIAAAGIARGEQPLLMVIVAIALAVAAIPEGLPIVATLALARGMWRMAHRNALVERLAAVETLGATTLILTDKTGTLTENRMTAVRLVTPSGAISIPADRSPIDPHETPLVHLIELGVLTSDAVPDGAEETGIGEPIEVALLRLGKRAGIDRAALLARCPEIGRHPFDSETRLMGSVHRGPGGDILYAVKGAPEAVLAHCRAVRSGEGDDPIGPAARAEWMDKVDALGRKGLRVIAIAEKSEAAESPARGHSPYADLVLLGLVGFEDPARRDVPAAIESCRAAGVRVAMVTGDHAVTANSIAARIGLADGGGAAVTGSELGSLLAKPDALREARVFARVNPDEKLALVRAFQQAGEVVAMTGDGVNDAPALRQADIGVAMGKRGTDVAREAAAIVLLDDAFPTIVAAIHEGRVIFGNIRRFTAFLLACNLSEVLVVAIAVLGGLPLPLLPLQILYLNLVTDVLPAFALAGGEGPADVMRRPPRPPGEPILRREDWRRIARQAILLAAATIGAMATARGWPGLAGDGLVTISFMTLAFAQLWHVFAMRSPGSHWLNNEVTRNPAIWATLVICSLLLIVPPYVPSLARMLQLDAPGAEMWGLVLSASLAPLVAITVTRLLTESRAKVRR